MVIKPTSRGGRKVYGKTTGGEAFSAEWDAVGVLIASQAPGESPLVLKKKTSWGNFRLVWERGQIRDAWIEILTPAWRGQLPKNGVGDHMRDVIRERRKVSGLTCAECRVWIDKMNVWGPDGCEQHADEIVAHLVSQVDKLGKLFALAVEWVPGGEAVAAREARSMLAEAISRCRTAA